MNMYEFQCDSTDEGKDISEGEMAYRIEEREGQFLVVEYLPDEPWSGVVVEWAKTRAEAERHIREYLAIRGGSRRVRR